MLPRTVASGHGSISSQLRRRVPVQALQQAREDGSTGGGDGRVVDEGQQARIRKLRCGEDLLASGHARINHFSSSLGSIMTTRRFGVLEVTKSKN